VQKRAGAKHSGRVSVASIRAFEPDDKEWAERLVKADFGGRMQARRGELVDALACPGLVAERAGSRVGLLTYRLGEHDAEIVFVEATTKHSGIGTLLVDAFVTKAAGRRMWLVTTNDNLEALRFYQRRGFLISALRAGAVNEARRLLKPQISKAGSFGIPIRDEIELENIGGQDS
jgi:ribosomal protein S18 acetylase RimI-like enzyme